MHYLIKASKNKPILWKIFKLVVLLVLLVFIFLKLHTNENFSKEAWESVVQVLKERYWMLLLVVLFMPVNWSLEAFKWKILSEKITPIAFVKAFEGVLAGLSISFITPHGLGDYFGRIMHSSSQQRGRLVGALMLGRCCQMVPTFLFGIIGVYYFVNDLMWVTLAAALTLFVLVVVAMVLITKMNKHSRKNNRIYRMLSFYFGVISQYSKIEILYIVLLSMARYVVFALQFYMITHLFLPHLDRAIALTGIAWIFLMKSILPTFNFLSDLGVREFSAVYFFDQYRVDLVAIISASLLLWGINILIPSIVGAPFTLKMKLRTQ